MRTHSIGLPLSQLSRMGWSIAESVFTSWWQFMHVSVGGTIARGARSTFTWQYRQSSPSCPACSRCEYGTGCLGEYPTCVNQGEK